MGKFKKFKRLLALCIVFALFACVTPMTFAEGETPPEPPSGDMPGEPPSGGQPGGQPGGSSSSVTYTSVYEYNEDTTIADAEINSTGTDENAILVSGGNVVMNRIIAKRTSSDSTGGDNASFYGVGAAILAKAGAAYINNSTITTDAAGGAGAFAYADGVVYIANTEINTTQDTSGGIHAAGGGTLYAWNVNATTQGGSAAAIRSDRGGGTMRINGGTYTSNGTGSPAIYCTADIAVNASTLTATNSEAICIEGLNTLRLYDCDLSGAMHDDSQNDCTWTVIVYQSMSGDSEVGCGTFTMSGGSLTSTNGGLFYTTNTESVFVLKNVTIKVADDAEFFLRCTGNANQRGWGTTGKNGAECKFAAISQEMNGDIQWDSISTLDLYMTEGSTLNGTFINDESCAGNGGSGYANLYIDKDSTWTVTGSGTLTNLYNAGTIKDADGKTVTIKSTTGEELVSGDSEYTITVVSYSEQADFNGASDVGEWSSYEVEMPTLLSSGGTNSGTQTGTATTESGTALPGKTGSDGITWIVIAAVAACIAVTACVVLIARKRNKA